MIDLAARAPPFCHALIFMNFRELSPKVRGHDAPR
jgi:hypothetical protein